MKTYADISLPQLADVLARPGTVLVDVRDEWEFDEFNLGGLNMPLPDIRARKAELASYQTLVVICTNGARSRVAARDFCRQPELRDKTILHVRGGVLDAE